MKFFLLISIFFSSLSFGATNKSFLKCLGKEEQYYHTKKLSGPYFKLNQKLISEFIQLSDTLTIKSRFQKKICNDKDSLPSMTLLKLILTHQAQIFQSLAHKNDVSQRSMDKRTSKEMSSMAVFALISFINELQAQAKKPNCVIGKIPELKEFYSLTRYTLEDQGVLRLLETLKDLESIFKKLNDKTYLKNC